MFQSARLKLTLWYVIIISIILVFFSFASYRGFGVEVERTLERQRMQFEQEQVFPDGSVAYQLSPGPTDPAVLQEARARILERILGIDLIILSLSTLIGYFLAGRTLKPIKNMVDEQNRFVTDASHELRTPLTSARTSLEVGLRDKNLTFAQSVELLKSNLDDVTHIQKLADNLLLLAQFEKTSAAVHFEAIELSNVLSIAHQRVNPLAKKRKIELKIDPVSFLVRGDTDSLVELFVILLDNAIKYSKQNSKVDVNVKRLDGHIVISVIDFGMGIDKKDLSHIFDRFYRADKSRTKSDASGYGLGLSIAKKIAEEHKGEINVESQVGKKTVFTVTLPRIKTREK